MHKSLYFLIAEQVKRKKKILKGEEEEEDRMVQGRRR